MDPQPNDAVWRRLAIVAVSCLVVMTLILVRREFFPAHNDVEIATAPTAARGPRPPVSAPEPPVQVSNWKQVAGSGHRIGPPDAPVTIVEFSDFQCPYCGRFARETFPALQSQFPGKVALLYRHWPLGGHRLALPAARAAECAADQGRFLAFHDLLFAEPGALTAKPFAEYAREAGVADIARFTKCASATGSVPTIQADMAEVRRIGGRGTPTLVINGMLMRPPYSPEALALQVEAALARANKH